MTTPLVVAGAAGEVVPLAVGTKPLKPLPFPPPPQAITTADAMMAVGHKASANGWSFRREFSGAEFREEGGVDRAVIWVLLVLEWSRLTPGASMVVRPRDNRVAVACHRADTLRRHSPRYPGLSPEPHRAF